jgi:hypothetical protein
MFDIITDFVSIVNTWNKKSYPKTHPPKYKYVLSEKYGNNFSFTEWKLPSNIFH